MHSLVQTFQSHCNFKNCTTYLLSIPYYKLFEVWYAYWVPLYRVPTREPLPSPTRALPSPMHTEPYRALAPTLPSPTSEPYPSEP